MSTKIEWADMTINPVVGCSKCSPGCDNCYAERFATRLAKNPATAQKYAVVIDEHGKWTGNFNVDLTPFASLPKKSKRIFIGSMCDIFHENASYNWFLWIVHRMSQYPQHTFILLTKRPQRMNKFISLTRETDTDCGLWPLPNLWIGVTVCNQAEADEKIPVLRVIPAAKRLVSVEPMIGPVEIGKYLYDTQYIDWVICGGETGPGARPMHPDWVRSLRDQCQQARVPFFFKSWGEWSADYTYDDAIRTLGAYVADTPFARIGKKRAGRLLDGVEHNEFPEVTV